MTRDALKVLPFLLLFAPGCPGGMDVSNLPPGHVDGGTPGQPFTYSDTSQVSTPLTADLGAPLTPDSGAQAAPDLAAATDRGATRVRPRRPNPWRCR